MRPVDSMKMTIGFLDKGIIPMGYGVPNGARLLWDMNKILSEMDPREARRMKRKFRKAWRSAVKSALRHGGKKGKAESERAGLSVSSPVRKHKMRRKEIVYRNISKKCLGSQ